MTHNIVKKIAQFVNLAIIGGLIYYCLEVLYRGYSHWTMFIVGGLCFIIMGQINNWISWKTPIYLQMLISTICVLVLEFIIGCILNLLFGMNIWDYSSNKYNILGQVCLSMVPIWYILSGVGIILDDTLRWILFDDEPPHYYII